MYDLDSLLFKNFSAVQNVVSNSGGMHHLSSLLSNYSLRFQNIASKCKNHRPYFHIARRGLTYLTPTLIKSKHVLFFLIAVSNIASQCARKRYCLENFLCKSFQVPSECTIYRTCFHCFFCSSKSFQIHPQYTFYRPWFHFPLRF